MRQSATLVILLAFTLLGCNPPRVASPSSSQSALPLVNSGPHLVTNVQGELTRIRPSWNKKLPVSFATELDINDLLYVGPSSSITIVCADLKTVVSISGPYQGGTRCSEAEPLLQQREGSLVVRPIRATLDELTQIPYIILPRHSFIQTEKPLLRWKTTTPLISNTALVTYTVRVWGDTLDWETQTTTNELIYPLTAPKLQTSTPYHITVTDNNGRSSAEEKTVLDLSFALLPPKEAEVIQFLVDQIQSLQVGDTAHRLLQAEIYATHGLRAESILLLEDVLKTENVPAVHLSLANLYLAMGLYLEADERFQQAIEGYHALGDSFGEAQALVGAGVAFSGLNQVTEAKSHFTQAKTLYETLGNSGAVAFIQGMIDDLGGVP